MGMSAIGGPVDHWVYMKGDAVCINTTSSVDPCTNTIDMGQQTEKSFGIKNSEYLTVTDKNTTQMRVRRVAKPGAVGIIKALFRETYPNSSGQNQLFKNISMRQRLLQIQQRDCSLSRVRLRSQETCAASGMPLEL